MHGHVARNRDRYYADIYEGLDPVTGKERRSWHPHRHRLRRSRTPRLGA